MKPKSAQLVAAVSYAEIAADAGVSRRTAIRAVKHLCKQGYLKRLGRDQLGRNVYGPGERFNGSD